MATTSVTSVLREFLLGPSFRIATKRGFLAFVTVLGAILSLRPVTADEVIPNEIPEPVGATERDELMKGTCTDLAPKFLTALKTLALPEPKRRMAFEATVGQDGASYGTISVQSLTPYHLEIFTPLVAETVPETVNDAKFYFYSSNEGDSPIFNKSRVYFLFDTSTELRGIGNVSTTLVPNRNEAVGSIGGNINDLFAVEVVLYLPCTRHSQIDNLAVAEMLLASIEGVVRNGK